MKRDAVAIKYLFSAYIVLLAISGGCTNVWDPWLMERNRSCSGAACPSGQVCNAVTFVCESGAATTTCGGFTQFQASVKSQLASCAALCHSPSKDTQAAQAFDMSDASSSDPYVLDKFCQSTLNRVNVSNPLQSALILQPTPAAQGGTANHPYKIADSAGLAGFRDAVVAWANAAR